MSNDENRNAGTGGPSTSVITKVKPKTKRPNLYRVLILNDDYTPMEFVVHVLEKFFQKDAEAATKIMVAMLCSFVPAIAEDAGEATRSSFEPRAAPVQKPADAARESDTREAMCLMIESAAKASDLPLEFFARVIWQESRFRSDAVGPMTRRGQRAQGIAQFMSPTRARGRR